MGGFRFNGCGVTDHFKKIKSLGLHMCPMCKRASEFFLEEAKQKIDIVFIPTLTLRSRYAVMCSKCGQGEPCSDQWAVNLINGTVPGAIVFESEAQKPSPPQRSPPSVVEGKRLPEAPQPQPAVRQETGSQAKRADGIPSFFKCSYCGVTQMREGDFCAYCGKPAPTDPDAREQPERAKGALPAQRICPSCGCQQPPNSKFCSTCGQALAAQQPEERICPGCGAKDTTGLPFCMVCGRKL